MGTSSQDFKQGLFSGRAWELKLFVSRANTLGCDRKQTGLTGSRVCLATVGKPVRQNRFICSSSAQVMSDAAAGAGICLLCGRAGGLRSPALRFHGFSLPVRPSV